MCCKMVIIAFYGFIVPIKREVLELFGLIVGWEGPLLKTDGGAPTVISEGKKRRDTGIRGAGKRRKRRRSGASEPRPKVHQL